MLEPAGKRVWRTSGILVKPSISGMMRCAIASIGRCFWIGGAGTSVFQARGRYTEARPLVWWRKESRALKTDSEGKETGSLAAAWFWVGGTQATGSAARRLRYLQ